MDQGNNGKHLAEWQHRVIDEARELSGRVDKLSLFLSSKEASAIDKEDRNLLDKQLQIMFDYQEVLAIRINRFPSE